jgi:FecR protein
LLLGELPKEFNSFSFEGNVMKRTLPVLLTLLSLLLISNSAFAQTPDDIASDAEDDAPAGRVVRVSFVEGDVSFQRAGTSEWAAVIENLPLFAGDQVYAGNGARIELQLGRGSYIRLSENSALTITELRDDAVQFDMPAGMAFVRVEQLAAAFKRFEVDVPNAALLLQADGLYRINVRGDDNSEVIVRRGAAEVSTDEGSFKLREGRRLLIDTSASGRLEVAYDTTQDDWDLWSITRDATIGQNVSAAPADVTQYETTYSDFYGVSDLSSYGSWYDDPSYGRCWRPRVTAGWAPYRQGQWLWTPYAGWTWVSSEPWGWAPYHYGRWVFAPAYGWAWVPGYGRSIGGYDNYRWRAYYRWRPALVGFFDAPSPRGHYVGWYPLAPGQHWRRPDSPRRDGDHSHLQSPTARDSWQRPGRNTFILPPHHEHGVSLLPVEGFTRADRAKTRPLAPDTDLSNWIKRGARPGLPEIKPAPVAIAPVLKDGEHHRVVVPANEIIHRPVVTRNRPSDSEATGNPPRERRLITPRPPVVSGDEPARREKRARGDEPHMKPPVVARPAEGKDSNPAHQKPNRQSDDGAKPLILPAERADGDADRAERKARRRNDEAAQPVNPNNSAGDDTPAREHKQRDEEQVRQREEERQRRLEEERARQRDEERARQRDEEQGRQRDEERARQRHEEHQRQLEEERQRQHNEEQVRQHDEERSRQRQEEQQRRNEEERARQREQEQNHQREEEHARQRNEEQNRQREEERNRQHNEEQQHHREKPPEHNTATAHQAPAPRSEPSREARQQQKQERRAEQQQRKKS